MASSLTAQITTALADRYTIERELGQGGMATVHLAIDRKHGRPVAVKVMRGELVTATGASRFLREITIAARLQHPNILTLIDSGETVLGNGHKALYYVMPYVEGETLRQHMLRNGPLPVPQVLRWLREIVDALAYAHTQGVVHRDLKPENVMLSNGHALLVDFGIARAMAEAVPGETLTGTGISLGTPAYMAPEQVLADASMDHRVDLYAAGVLAYEMLTGRTPFSGAAHAILSSHVTVVPDSVHAARPETPAPLAAIVARCLEKDPGARPTAEGLLSAIDASLSPAGTRQSRWSQRTVLLGAAAAVLVAGTVSAAFWRERRVSWVHAEAIPLIRSQADAGDFEGAFATAQRAAAILPDDPTLAALWRSFSHHTVLRTEPAGATVYRARLDDSSTWERIGVTPTDSIRVPASLARYRFELAGYQPATLMIGGYLIDPQLRTALGGAPIPVVVPLVAENSQDSLMVGVAGPFLTGATEDDAPRLRDFLIDRFEVSNAEYRAFVEAGGYRRQEFWTEPFVLEGRNLTWEEATARMVDRTGRHGPALWEGGAPPIGEDDLPVGGISWYEAMAYAQFAGKSLPTLLHWRAAAGRPAAAHVVPGSVFGATAPMPRSRVRGVSPWGLADVAGNVREWTRTDNGAGNYHIPGGGWNDHSYRFIDEFTRPPFDRQPLNGVRLARYPVDDPNLQAALTATSRGVRDVARELPVPDATFASLLEMYDYDPHPLEPRVELRDTSHAEWIKETVSFVARYDGGVRMRAIVFLPRRHAPPYQALVLFPGSDALFDPFSANADRYVELLSFVLRSGRALVLPEYHALYDRRLPQPVPTGESIAYRDMVLTQGKDLRRAVDYLVTRQDMDSSRLAYVGVSMGGRMGGVLAAIEPRFRAAILYVAGFSMARARPEAEPVNFLPRIRLPVLMLNGKYDDVFPVATSQEPFYRMIGATEPHKRHVLFDNAHDLPRAQMISESLGWLDRYLGPVAK